MANLPVREVNRVQMVLRVFLQVIFSMFVAMLRLLISKVSLAIVGALIVAGAIFAAISMAPPPKAITGQVQQHSMEELTVQFATAPVPLSLPLLHVSSYDIQWRSVGTGESWTTEGEISILGVTEVQKKSLHGQGLDPERVIDSELEAQPSRCRRLGRTGSLQRVGTGPGTRLQLKPTATQRPHPRPRLKQMSSGSTPTNVQQSARRSPPS